MKIFIDPGHGGTDPGAIRTQTNLQEATVNLDVAKRLESILKARGYETRMSRTTDTYVSLSSRANMANSWGADYYISVHCNSSDNPTANGTETLYYFNAQRAKALAQDVQNQLIAQTGLRDRGIKEQNVAVLRLSNMPAVLAELAFISNPNEAYLLSTESFRQKCAQGIADGLQIYLNRN